MTGGNSRKVGRLSARETEVAWLLNGGFSIKASARQLGLRPRTVESFIYSASKKLGFEGQRQVRLALFVERNKPQFRRAMGVAPRSSRKHEPDNRVPTPREREIAALVHDGFTYDEVATRLGMSTKTVNVHIGHLADKIGGRGSPLVRVVRWWATASF